ncbi:pentapeptide repeat-containing protein [Kitasatospora sp. NPDC096128]|uniref:pentapeptide repeat-containing protein n=1 Tax=Kitasatospora sp. NPDC096128 TaxID=3155547 RepID=UPI00332C4A8E
MTTLLSVLDSTWSALAAGPPPQPRHQGAAAGSQWTVFVGSLLGLVGVVIGAGIGLWAAKTTARQQRKSARHELRQQRVRLLNERFATASELLGHTEPAHRLAGVHAMAGLADDWHERRQTCIDVLCAQLRMPYPTEPGAKAPAKKHLAWRADREVRHTVLRVICDHLQEEVSESATSWTGHAFDFTGAVFDGGAFTGACFTGSTVDFSNSEFSSGTVDFSNIKVSGGRLDFSGAQFLGGTVNFHSATFSDGGVSFSDARFSGASVDFTRAKFVGGLMTFLHAEFYDGRVAFDMAEFADGTVSFVEARFTGGKVAFTGARFTGCRVEAYEAEFSDSPVIFDYAEFIDGSVNLRGARLRGGSVEFHMAHFAGCTVDFRHMSLTGGRIIMWAVAQWTHPPLFDDGVLEAPPTDLQLPIEPQPQPQPPEADGLAGA